MQFLKKLGKYLNKELRAHNFGFECNHVHLFFKSLVSCTSFALFRNSILTVNFNGDEEEAYVNAALCTQHMKVICFERGLYLRNRLAHPYACMYII